MQYIARGMFAVALASSPVLAARAQTPDTLSQQGRTLITFGLGLSGTREASVVAGQSTASSSGQVASLAFTHFVSPQVAIEITAAALDANASADAQRAYTESITPLLVGLSYSPRAMALSTSLRPYVSAAIGPYFHSISSASGTTNVQSTVQSEIGARVGAGVNWFVANHVLMQISGDYHAVNQFDAVNGVRKDPSGFGMSFGVGFAWGKQ